MSLRMPSCGRWPTGPSSPPGGGRSARRDRALLMGSRRLLENLRDTSGRFRGDVLESLWAEMPDRFRTIDLASNDLDTDDLTAFLTDPRGPGFRIRFGQLPAAMDREMAWCCWRIA